MARIRRTIVPTSLGQVVVRHGGAGKPVITIHHTYGSSASAMRDGYLEKLADHYAVYAPDTIGQGTSDHPPRALEIADYAANLAEVMDAFGVERASLIGHHTGASIALELAASRPERVEALVFEGLTLWTPEQRAENIRSGRFNPWTMTDDGSYLRKLWDWRISIAHDLTPEQTHWQFMEFLSAGPKVAAPLLALSRYNPLERLPLVQAPTLSTRGPFEPIVERLPSAVQADVPRGTLFHTVDSAAFLTAVTEFLG